MFRIYPGRRAATLLVCLAIGTAAGCSGRGATSVAAPTAATASVQPGPAIVPTGATISGTVVGVSSTASAGSRLFAQSVSITVTVTGSSVASTVDGNGRFTLDNVPTGHVDLHFSGPGIDAHLGIDNVNEHATITITVRLSGNGAQLEDDHGAPNSGPGNGNAAAAELKGAIAAGSVTGSCAAGTLSFMVAATKVVTNSATRFDEVACSGLQAGVRVEVKGTRQADNSVVATSVEGDDEGEDDDHDEQHDAEVKGTIAAGSLTGSCGANTLAFKIGTTMVKTNGATQFKETPCASLKAGDSVEAKGARQSDSSLLASRVEKKK